MSENDDEPKARGLLDLCAAFLRIICHLTIGPRRRWTTGLPLLIVYAASIAGEWSGIAREWQGVALIAAAVIAIIVAIVTRVIGVRRHGPDMPMIWVCASQAWGIPMRRAEEMWHAAIAHHPPRALIMFVPTVRVSRRYAPGELVVSDDRYWTVRAGETVWHGQVLICTPTRPGSPRRRRIGTLWQWSPRLGILRAGSSG